MWYLDCYCHGALGGRDFPVNSYSAESLPMLVEAGVALLNRKNSGIDAISIGQQTKGQSPVPLDTKRDE